MSGERLVRLEHAVTDLETRLEASDFEGARDRLALEELVARVEHLERDLAMSGWVRLLEQRYFALEHAVGVFAGTGDAAALFEFVRRANQDARGIGARS